MSFSSGTRAMIGEATSWLVAGGLCVVAFFYFDDLRHLSSGALGLHVPEQAEPARRAVETAPAQVERGGTVELRASEGGHYHAEAEINGRPVSVLVDTGATLVALTYEDAEKAGLYLKPADFTASVRTANGTSRVAIVKLGRVSIGGITVRDVQGAVAEPGKMSITLLGMSFLGRLERVDMRGGTLILHD